MAAEDGPVQRDDRGDSLAGLRFGSDDGVAVMGGASRRMRQYAISQFLSLSLSLFIATTTGLGVGDFY